MLPADLLYSNREKIVQLAARHGARNVRVFGSVLRGEDSPGGDIDLLVSTETVTSPWFPAGLIADLEALLGLPVDVVTEQALHWMIRNDVLQHAKPL